VWVTFTPLQGVSTAVKRFLHEKSPDRYKVVMTIDDVEHYSDDEKKTIIASYPAHEAEARVKQYLAQVECSLSRRKHLPLTKETCHRTGRASAAWILVGIIRSRLWNWFGTSIVTLCTSLGRIG